MFGFLKRLLGRRTHCPHCGFSYFWENTAPGQCDGCGYPTTHEEE